VSLPLRPRVLVPLTIATILILGLMLAQDQETLRIVSAVTAEDERYPAYVAALVGADLTRGNAYDVLTNGDEIFPAMLAAIDGARRRISFETYIYEGGEVGDKFTAALENAARRGVAVTLIADSIGTNIEPSHIDRLQAAGCRVEWFNPTTWYSLEHVNYRTHRKILVVDGEIGFTGGAGVADHWLGHAQDPEHWRDTQIRMRGPIVRLLEAAFYEDLIDTGGVTTPVFEDEPELLDREGASFLVRSSPTGGSNDLKRLYLLLIASAQRTLDIATPYFVMDESTIWSLEQAAKRRVRIRILVEGDNTDAMPVKHASRADYDRLMSLGIEIYEYAPTMMHAKVLVVDGLLSMFGSANFDNRSLELNEELNIAVTGRDLASRLTSDFEQDLQTSTRLELEMWRARSPLLKAQEWFWSAFGEVF